MVLRLTYDLYTKRTEENREFNFANRFDLYSQIIKEAKKKQKKLDDVSNDFDYIHDLLPYISFYSLEHKTISEKLYKQGIEIERAQIQTIQKHILEQMCRYYFEDKYGNATDLKIDNVIDSFKAYDSIFSIFTHEEGLFEYSHQSFQEYFAACHILEMVKKNMSVNEVKKYFYHPLFEGVMIFLGGALDTGKLEELVTFLIQTGHDNPETRRRKKLTLENLQVASLLIKEAKEKDRLIEVFWNETEKLISKRIYQHEVHLWSPKTSTRLSSHEYVENFV